jgi:DNA-binding transcriptional LysR family regulator
MELKQIQYFEMVYKKNSFSKAAEELLVTQQCVSKIIQHLESELSTKLFVRTPNGVRPTEEAGYLHEQASILLQTQDNIIRYYTGRKNQQKSIFKLGVSHGLRYFFNERCFEEFSQKHPETELQILDLWNAQTEEMVRNNAIDIGFTLAPVKYSDLHIEHIRKEPLYCIVNKTHPFAQYESISIDDVLNEKIVMANENFNSYYNFQLLCVYKGKQPDTVKVSDLLSIYEYVAHNNAIGFTLKSYYDILQFQDIKYIPLDDPMAYWDICLVHSQNPRKVLVPDFVRYVKKALKTELSI